MDYKASSFPGTGSRTQRLVSAIGFLILPRPALAKARFRLHRGAQSEPTRIADKPWGVNAHLEEAACG